MDTNAYFETVYKKFKQDDFELAQDEIDGFNVTVATKKQFRLSWLATQMNIFAVMGTSKAISKDVIEKFSKLSLDYAIKNNRGLPRGLQSGVASFALLVSSNVDEEAKKFVQQRPKKHFAAAEMPIVYDLREDTLYYYEKTPIWGMIYYKGFRDFVKIYFR